MSSLQTGPRSCPLCRGTEALRRDRTRSPKAGPPMKGNHRRHGGRGPVATARPCAGLLPLKRGSVLPTLQAPTEPGTLLPPGNSRVIPRRPVTIFASTARRLSRERMLSGPQCCPPRPPLTLATLSGKLARLGPLHLLPASPGRPWPRLLGSKGPWRGSPQPTRAASSHRHPASLPFLRPGVRIILALQSVRVSTGTLPPGPQRPAESCGHTRSPGTPQPPARGGIQRALG